MIRRSKYKHDYGLTHMYKFYKEKYTLPLNYKSFKQIIDVFNSKLINEIYKGAFISLPYSLGDLFIYKYKKKIYFDNNGEIINKNKRCLFDYKATKELWKEHPELEHKQRVLYDNSHTDNFRFHIAWKRYNTIRLHKLYNFKPARDFSRGLARYLKSNPNQNYYDR